MNVLVVEEVRGLQEAFVTQVAFERPVRRVLVCASVAHQSILLLEAHLTLITVEGTLLRVGALVLAEVGWPLETFATCGTAKRAGTLRVAGVVEQLRRLFEMQLAQVAFEQVLTGVHVHVAHEVGPVFETLFTDGTLERAVVAVCSLVVL